MLLSRKDRYNDLISVNIELAPVVRRGLRAMDV